MDEAASDELKRIWHQDEVPVIVRKGAGHPLHVKLPHASPNLAWRLAAQDWLQVTRIGGRAPLWRSRYKGWEIPKSWFDDLVRRLLSAHRALYIIQPYREQEKCAPACMNATGHECQCSCMGAHHGSGGPGAGWFVASDAFAARWGTEQLACRLMKRTN